MANSLSKPGAAIIQYFEGTSQKFYLDPVGIGTIGTGFTWASAAFRQWWVANRPGVKFGPGATMTKAESAEVLVLIIAEEYGAAVNRFVGNKTLPQHVYDASSSMTFNCGPGALDWNWAEAMRAGDYSKAAALLKGTATTAKGKKLAGLVTRRREEAELMEFADYAIGSVAVDPMADGMLVRKERGEAVRELQRDLSMLGIYDGAIDGIFGYGTEAAVLEFQRSQGLAADGFAGPATLAAVRLARMPAPVAIPSPRPVPPPPAPSVQAPATPQPPAAPSAPTPSPIDQVSKPNGGAKWGSAIAAILVVAVNSDILPPQFNTPELVSALTAIAVIIAGYIGTYRAPPNAQ